jgi:23S rRNA (adenine2030-N6)-methyltransferase
MKSDYPKLVDAMRDAMKRFAEGVYCVWYPIISRADHLRMIESLTKLSDKTLNLTMEVQLPKDDGFGMQGSGLFLINPPWNLAQTMAPTMSYLVGKLGQHAHASFSIT